GRQEVPGLFCKVLKNRAGFKDCERARAVSRLMVDDHRNLVRVRTGQIGGVVLLALAQVNGNETVVEGHLLERDRDLVDIGTGGKKEIDHGLAPSWFLVENSTSW